MVGAVRLVAALAFGTVVFQAAQSLQVPAYDPGLARLSGWSASWTTATPSPGSASTAGAMRAVLAVEPG